VLADERQHSGVKFFRGFDIAGMAAIGAGDFYARFIFFRIFTVGLETFFLFAAPRGVGTFAPCRTFATDAAGAGVWREWGECASALGQSALSSSLMART